MSGAHSVKSTHLIGCFNEAAIKGPRKSSGNKVEVIAAVNYKSFNEAAIKGPRK